MRSEALFDQLLRITLLLQHDLAQSLEPMGLTPARTHLLWEVQNRGPSTQQSLASALRVTPRNITGLVDALAAAGYVERRPHPDDRRATLVTLTEPGVTIMTGMAAERRRVAADLTDGLDAPELDKLVQQLGAIADRLAEMVAASSTTGSNR
jgi:DNA-binding MarR family transcriptional regulator